MHYTPHRALKSSKRYYNRYVLKLGFIGQKLWCINSHKYLTNCQLVTYL